MRKKNLKKIDINNDYIKLYLRLLKEEDLYKDSRFLSNYRYDELMSDLDRNYKQNTLQWIISIPDMLIDTIVEYNKYYKIHSTYLHIIINDIISNAIKTLYKISSDDTKKILNKNRKLIKEDIKHQYLNKIVKRNLNGTLFNTFVKTVFNVLLIYNIHDNYNTTQPKLAKIFINKRKYKFINKI